LGETKVYQKKEFCNGDWKGGCPDNHQVGREETLRKRIRGIKKKRGRKDLGKKKSSKTWGGGGGKDLKGAL